MYLRPYEPGWSPAYVCFSRRGCHWVRCFAVDRSFLVVAVWIGLFPWHRWSCQSSPHNAVLLTEYLLHMPSWWSGADLLVDAGFILRGWVLHQGPLLLCFSSWVLIPWSCLVVWSEPDPSSSGLWYFLGFWFTSVHLHTVDGIPRPVLPFSICFARVLLSSGWRPDSFPSWTWFLSFSGSYCLLESCSVCSSHHSPS